MVNCCGGSFRTFGNMNRPVAARHPAVAAVNEPHANPSQPRRDINGDVSSATFALGRATGLLAAALVVFPTSAGFIGGGGAGFGLGFAGAGFGVSPV